MPSPVDKFVGEEKVVRSEMMPWHIYILADPRDAGVIRYVGVTNEPERRAREHVTRARGHECSEQTRRLLREAHLGLKASPEARANMRKAQLGRRASADTCTKMSRSHQGTLKTSSHRAHISAAMLGNQNGLSRKDSEEVRARRNAAVKAAWARRKVAQGVPDACALFKEA